jgi:hypothetical protein
MSQKASLSKALNQASQGNDNDKVIQPELERNKNVYIPAKVRQNRKIISGHFDSAISYRMKRLALERETTVQNLLAEALDDLFNKYSAPTKTK